MKLISWNINGLRAVLAKGLLQKFVRDEQPDLLLLQEIKARPEQVELPSELAGMHAVWNPAERPGYSGTLTLSKMPFDDARTELGVPELDGEGRVVTTRHGGLTVVNVYTPNSGDGLRRLGYRQHEWDPGFREYVSGLAARGSVLWGGDLNVAHQPIDIARPKENERSPGYTIEEREGFERLLAAGFIDTFRHFEPGPGHYSWWSYRAGARARNVGWRIDYFGASSDLAARLAGARILSDVQGSDHCPVVVDIA